MYEKTEEQVLDYIRFDNRNDNLLLTDVSEEQMTNIMEYLAQPDAKSKGYLTIDFPLEEVNHVEAMILNTGTAFDMKEIPELKTQIDELQKGIEALNALTQSNPSLTETLDAAKQELFKKIKELDGRVNINDKQSKLRRFLITSAIAEEYVIGKIASKIVEVPELRESCKIADIDTKLQYFQEFMTKDGISSEEYEDFNNRRFSLAMESLPLLQRSHANITCCFTNFQNISDSLINRVVNSFTWCNTMKLRTMILTTADSLLTYACRDEGSIGSPYEYQEYTLNATKQQALKFVPRQDD